MQPGSDALPSVSLYSAVISADLDLVVQRAAALLTSYDVKNDSTFVYDPNGFRSYELVDDSNPFMEAVACKLKDPHWTVKEVLATYACLVGYDYFKNVKGIGHVRVCEILETVEAPGPQTLYNSLQSYEKALDVRPEHLLESRRAWHCWFNPWVTQISLAPGHVVLQHSFIFLSLCTMPTADVLSVVGLYPMDQAGNPAHTTVQDFVVGCVDSLRQRYLLSHASTKDKVYTPATRALLCDSMLQLLPCESVPRQHRLTLRKDDQVRVVTHLVAVPQQRPPTHMSQSRVGTALYSCCPTIQMPKLYGGNSQDYGEVDLALGACDESYHKISKANLPHPDTWDASITLDYLKGYAMHLVCL